MSTPHGQPPDGGSGGGRERGLRARAAALVGRLDLRDRVTLATAVVLAGGLAVLSAGALLLLSGQLDHDVSSTLSERADAQQAAVAQVGGRTVVRRTPDDVLDEQAWIFDASGRALLRPRVAPAVERAARSLAGVSSATERDVGEDVRLRAEPVYASDGGGESGGGRAGASGGGGPAGGRARASGGGGAPGGTTASDGGERIGTVVVGVSLEPYERTEHLALLAIAFLDVCIVAFGALLARRAVGKALQPVADMTAQAADWSEHDLDRRFDLGPPRDELTALSATLDGLLARIASSVRREQRFSAEMAHELRTPLAGVRAEAELALRAPDTPDDARIALERVLRGTDRMQAVIDALLSAARGESGSGGVSDAAAAARAAVDAAAPAAARAGVRVELLPDASQAVRGEVGAVPAPASRVRGEAGAVPALASRVGAEQQLVVQALAPLLDNAIRHARARVTLRIERDHGDVLLRVRDDGDGFAADDAETVFAAGVSSSGGAGLGLPLARRLARSAGGDVVVEPRPGAADGGAAVPPATVPHGDVVLRLPAVA